MNTNTLRVLADELDVIVEEMAFINHGLSTIDSDEPTGAIFLLGHIQDKLAKLAQEAAANPLPTAGGQAHV